MDNNKLSDYLEKAETLTESSRPELINLEKFTTVLNSAPDQDKIKSRQNINYLPISTIENELDRLYAGLWQVKNLSFTIVTNEILVSLDLQVFHPIAKTWITRAGVGACMIRQRSGAQISDVNAKLKNALQMDLPHAKAEAIKNAAKSLGDKFGRNLGRKTSDTTKYKPILLDKLKTLKNGNNK
jgi:hypothetical protein